MTNAEEMKAFFSRKRINPDETKGATSPVLVEIADFPARLGSNHELNGEKSYKLPKLHRSKNYVSSVRLWLITGCACAGKMVPFASSSGW